MYFRFSMLISIILLLFNCASHSSISQLLVDPLAVKKQKKLNLSNANNEKIAVLQLQNKAKLDPDDVNYITTQIQEKVQFKTKGSFQVMTQENILTLLPPDKTLEDCTASECEVDTGRILGATLIITGQIVKFGSQKDLRCTIKLHETKNGTLLSSQTIKAKSIEDIENQLLGNIDQLLINGLGEGEN